MVDRRPLEEIRSKGIANVVKERIEEIRVKGMVPTLRTRVEEIVERVRSRGEMSRGTSLTRERVSESAETQKLKKVRRGL